jgi:hypothetical protein
MLISGLVLFGQVRPSITNDVGFKNNNRQHTKTEFPTKHCFISFSLLMFDILVLRAAQIAIGFTLYVLKWAHDNFHRAAQQ